MARYIDADALYEKTAEWEAQALHEVERHMTDEDDREWRRWSTILTERSAFKFDVADAPTADVVERKKGEWIKHSDRDCWYCSECKSDNYFAFVWNNEIGKHEFQDNYCPNCGADMKGERDGKIH